MSGGDDLDSLIARAQEGEVRAFEQLIGTLMPQVRRFARAFTRSEADADDLAQEAMVKVYKSLRLFRFQAAFSTWLFAVVRNVFLDVAKSRASRERSIEEPLVAEHLRSASGEALADEQLTAEEDRQRLWRLLGQVPLEFRTALVLFDIEGRSYDEVAAIEGVPVGTVKSRLSRGRGHLRRLLGAPSQEAAGSGTLPTTTSSHSRRSGP